jgi:glycosyltransferase involved in cell wall biosynthesis
MSDWRPIPVARSPERPSLLIVATTVATIRGFLTPYAAHFRSLGWRVDAAANGATTDPSLVDVFDHIHELPLSRSLRDVRGLARAVRSLDQILEEPPDIVHVHTPIAGFLTRLLIRRMPVDRRPAVAYTAHGFHFYEGGHLLTNVAFLTAERLAGRWTDRLIVISDDDEKAARRHRIVASQRLVHMPGIGVNTRFYAPIAVPIDAPAKIREQLGIPAHAPLFAIVGELSRNKRQKDAISALTLMRHAGAHLMLAGSGPEREALEFQARGAGVEEYVHFLGQIDNVRSIVRSATALVLPSRREGLARAVMEALSLEVPVIASTARGNRELLGREGGLVFETGDVRALAGAMDWMIDHPDERQQMGVRGRARMVERFGLDILLRLHEELYEAILAERASIAHQVTGSCPWRRC